jgi:hypothetical protein
MADSPTNPSRALVLHVMLSLLASAAVFVMIAQLFLVPQLARQEAELRSLRAEITELRGALEEEASQAAAKAAATTTATTPPPAAQPAAAAAAAK